MATKRRQHDDEAEEPDPAVADEDEGTTLEEKYRDQMRQIFPTRIDLPLYTLASQIDAQIDLRPDFQRRDRWTPEMRSRFIESIIMNVPVPPVFLGEEEYAKFVVLDGRQRLTAAYLFMTNQLRLEKLKVWVELNGKTYDEIKKLHFAPAIERRFLPAILLTRESSPEVKYDVFDRLNTGGVIANPMEVRNAIFPGPFNKALHELSSDRTFRRLWGIPDSMDPVALERNSHYKEMADLEYVLRFFALKEATLHGVRFKDHLSAFMEERNKAYLKRPVLGREDAALFMQAVHNCEKVFGDDAFKKRDVLAGRQSAPYADAVMQSLATVSPAKLKPDVVAAIRAAFDALAANEDFKKAVSTGTNGQTAIKNRIELARAAVAAALKGGRASSPARKPRKR